MPSGHSCSSRDALSWLPLGLSQITAIAGLFGPWVAHRTAGLTLTGVDLPEYVKFLPEVMSGGVTIQREAFFIPLCVASATAGLLAGRRALPSWARVLFGVLAVPLALAMLPPAWSPTSLLLPDYRLQLIAILACLAIPLLCRLTRHVPTGVILMLLVLLALVATVWPAWSFLRVRPAIDALYGIPPATGWGFWLCAVGEASTALIALATALRRS